MGCLIATAQARQRDVRGALKGGLAAFAIDWLATTEKDVEKMVCHLIRASSQKTYLRETSMCAMSAREGRWPSLQ
jgi:hypothetical protein